MTNHLLNKVQRKIQYQIFLWTLMLGSSQTKMDNWATVILIVLS